MVLGAPGHEGEGSVKGKSLGENPSANSLGSAIDFNPAKQRVDLREISDVERHMESIDACLGPAASRYFHLHYYSQASKAVFVRAYWHHHQDADGFVTHLFRRGVLPMLSIYIWELLQTSFNWKMALKAGVGENRARDPGSTSWLIDAEELDKDDCPECRDKERLVLRVEKEASGSEAKGKRKA